MFITAGSRAGRKRSTATGGGGTPASPTGSVQYNNAGAFGAFGFWDGSATLRIANLGTAQTLQVFNTTDSNSSPVNYERGSLDWNFAANVLTVGVQAGGTGNANRDIQIRTGGAIGLVNTNVNGNYLVATNLNGPSGGALAIQAGAAYLWVNGNAANGTPDTGFHRNAPAVIFINRGNNNSPAVITGSLSTTVWQQHHDNYGGI